MPEPGLVPMPAGPNHRGLRATAAMPAEFVASGLPALPGRLRGRRDLSAPGFTTESIS